MDGYCEKCKYYVSDSVKAEMNSSKNNTPNLINISTQSGDCYFNPPEVKGRPRTQAWDFCVNYERASDTPRYGPLGYRRDKPKV